ncbi:hypothetical protein CTA2_10076 [Colletotrichum tanaceti]|uniref:Uncharacterized protein n=1 Tax=Colletotrichum tanaceti TaxID=1306861 RepID=A0A4U6XBH9_9PEZI|nr:hypothetical protein CTA2_10076 [Colletotrichum tanaceti]TKW51087.1 hypothetical protein CTA1_6152 [Colletotrichum tanaceti]
MHTKSFPLSLSLSSLSENSIFLNSQLDLSLDSKHPTQHRLSKMDRIRSHETPHVFRLPSELHFQILMGLDSASDLRAWISASDVAFAHFLEYKATVFRLHMADHLLPEALAVLRLRRIHEESAEPAKARDLVNLTCELLEGADPRAPSNALLPRDFDTVAALLELIDDLSLIFSGVTQCRNHPILSVEHTPCPDSDCQPRWRERYIRDKWHQRPILLFELHAQALLYRNYETYEDGEEQELYDRLGKAFEVRLRLYYSYHYPCRFEEAVQFVCRRNDDYLQLALRKVVRIDEIGGQPGSTSHITAKEPARNLREAVDDPIVCSRSTRLFWANGAMLKRIQGMSAVHVDLIRGFRDDDVSVTLVGTWHDTSSGDEAPVYRLARPEGEIEGWNGNPREYLYKKDRDGYTAVASLLLLREREGWTPADDIHNLRRMIAGGIRPLAQLMRMTPPERQQRILDQYVRPASNVRCRVIEHLQQRQSLRGPLWRKHVIEQYSGIRFYLTELLDWLSSQVVN